MKLRWFKATRFDVEMLCVRIKTARLTVEATGQKSDVTLTVSDNV